VLLGQDDEPLVGKAAIEASLKQDLAANPTMKVLKYVPEITDLQLVGDAAYDWGFSTRRTNSRRIASRRVFAPGFCV